MCVGRGGGGGGVVFDLIKLPNLLYVFGQTCLSKQYRSMSDITEHMRGGGGGGGGRGRGAHDVYTMPH